MTMAHKLVSTVAGLALLMGSTGLAYTFPCPDPRRFGGELGPDPRWATPICDAPAQQVANDIVSGNTTLKIVSVNVYKAQVDAAGAARVASDLTALMRRAGYALAENRDVGQVNRSVYVNQRKNAGFQVLLSRPAAGLDYVMVLLRYNLR